MGALATRSDFEVLARVARRLADGDPEDLAQDAWIAALSEPAGVQRREGWLVGVVRNRARMRRRTAMRRRAREERAAAPDTVLGVEDALQRVEVLERLRQALAELPAGEAELVHARYFDGCNAQQIAGRLGIPASTVRTRLARTLARLRTDMDRRCGGERVLWAGAAVALPRGGTSTASVATAVSMTKSTLTFAAVAASALLLGAWATLTPPSATGDDATPVPAVIAAATATPAPNGSDEPPPKEPSAAAPKTASLAAFVAGPGPTPDPLDAEIEAIEQGIANPDPEHDHPDSARIDRELLMKQTAEAWVRCAGESTFADGQYLLLYVHLLPEATEEGLVDQVTVAEARNNPEGFVTCVAESTHTFDFAPPSEAVIDTYRLEIDGEWESIGINEFLTPDTVLAALDQYPELSEGLLMQVSGNEALEAVVREALQTDPEFAARHPDAKAALL